MKMIIIDDIVDIDLAAFYKFATEKVRRSSDRQFVFKGRINAAISQT